MQHKYQRLLKIAGMGHFDPKPRVPSDELAALADPAGARRKLRHRTHSADRSPSRRIMRRKVAESVPA